MFKNFLPDGIYGTYKDITPEMLKKMNVKALLLDIDNTLVTYDDLKPTEEVYRWLAGMEESGIKIAFISNNSSPDRVDEFNKGLGFYAASRSAKPLKKGFKRAMKALGVKPRESLAIGDQIFTDVWGAKRAGARAILVPPIKDKTTLFFRVKRLLEKPVIRKYKKIKEREEKK